MFQQSSPAQNKSKICLVAAKLLSILKRKFAKAALSEACLNQLVDKILKP
jgi:hypothetical protein